MSPFLSPDDIRAMFSRAMSEMYRAEAPQYGVLVELVGAINAEALQRDPELKQSLAATGELARLSEERHGAIRLGAAAELPAIGRLFAIMGMQPVGYYDLSVAGIPVHSTAFRPIDDAGLARNPFRIFTSLLRLELIEDEALRAEAEQILARRKIISPRALALIELAEERGGLNADQAGEFTREALETFRWRNQATVSAETYARLCRAHPLVADVVSFTGPHINHLTPRTLDIDEAQARMRRHGLTPKATIEGPPRRRCPILLRQTSFLALEEDIVFAASGEAHAGTHRARFGEIEQRGAALTRKGRKIYDETLASGVALPDDWGAMRAEKLAYFRYAATIAGIEAGAAKTSSLSLDELIEKKFIRFYPIVYEDFLPVSAAGIFRSNLGDAPRTAVGRSSRAAFESALGRPVLDEFELYAAIEKRSLGKALSELGGKSDS